MVTPGVYEQDVIEVITVKETVYQQDVINRDRLSTWFIVDNLGQGMKCYKCNSTSNVFVCEICVCVCPLS